MKYLKSMIFFIFIIVMFIALWVNIIVVNSHKTPKTDIFASIDGIYFDLSLLNRDIGTRLSQIINSNKSAVFSKLINQKDPIQQFYGFTGFMKGNQKSAISYLEELLVSSKNVTIYYNGEKIESTLGYAILLLIKNMPENLTNRPIEGFYELSEEKVYNAYNSSLFKNDPLYSESLSFLITEKYPVISKKIYEDTLSFDNLKSKSIEEKIKLSSMISTAPAEKKEEVIIDLLQERNDKISLNVLNSITETVSKTITDEIYKIITTSNSNEVLSIAIKKYSQFLKVESIPNIEIFLKTLPASKEKIVMLCLEQIYDYGNESSYEFLKSFLETNYSPQINLFALKTIIQTTYKTRQSYVLKTFLYIIKYYEITPVVVFTIKFFIDNKIVSYNDMVLSRISRKENSDIKKIGIEYISNFKVTEGIGLLKELTNDDDSEVKNKATEVLQILQQ